MMSKKEKVKLYNDKYIIDNKEKIKERLHRYYIANIEKNRIKNKINNAKQRANKVKQSRKVEMNTTPSDGKLTF